MGREKTLLILILLSSIFVSCASKPKNVNSVNDFSVLIIDEKNQPIAGFTTFIRKRGGGKKTYITNEEGLFYVPDFKGKEFIISGQKNNYALLEEQVVPILPDKELFCWQIKSAEAVLDSIKSYVQADNFGKAYYLLETIKFEKSSDYKKAADEVFKLMSEEIE
ncbi:MAG: hypothetical protein K5866_06660 [Treponema sp.]|nr:hypothetical protein [Treponema sp.]